MKRRAGIFLFLDFDGTLAPLAPTPSQARMTGGFRVLLKKIAARKEMRLAILSGRALPALHKKVRIPGLLYAGNHGLEIQGPGLRFVEPHARRAKPRMQRVYSCLRHALKAVPGAWVENKGLTLSVHYRQVRSDKTHAVEPLVGKCLAAQRAGRVLRVTPGKKVLEIRPRTTWGKGKALLHMLRHANAKDHTRYIPVFAGDDVTDEAAFVQVKKLGGLGIWVGKKKAGLAASLAVASPQKLYDRMRCWYTEDMPRLIHNGEARLDPPQ